MSAVDVPQDVSRSSARVHVQKLGTALSNMVMPNIGAFIAWGLITALFIKTGWLPGIFHDLQDPGGWVAQIGGWGDFDGKGIVGPMITYLLPILIGYTGGRMVHGNRGAVVGAIATMGVVAGADVPMFMGAMIMGPLGGWAMKKADALWEGKIRPGFEMLVDNFSAGILGLLLAVFGFFGIGPIVSGFTRAAGNAVDFLVNHDLLPLTSILIEPAKVLFLNNAINHGVLTPLGTTQALEAGKSILFLLEANPGPGLGLLLAYMFFGKGVARASAPGAAIIQFFGGIHEIYFPYVLMPRRARSSRSTRRPPVAASWVSRCRYSAPPQCRSRWPPCCSRPTRPPTSPTWRPRPPRWSRSKARSRVSLRHWWVRPPAARSPTSSSRATPAWAPRRWEHRCCAGKYTPPGSPMSR